MQKQSPKSESTWKTEQDRSGWKFFDLVKVNSQWMTCANVAVWRHPRADVAARETKLACVALMSAWGAWRPCVLAREGYRRHVAARGGAWSACSWGRNFSQCVGARVRCFLAVLGWVLLGIVCSVTQCLCFDSWMSRTMRSESCWDCGRDGGDSLLIVTTGWRRGQRKKAGDVHRNQKVRGMALIPC